MIIIQAFTKCLETLIHLGKLQRFRVLKKALQEILVPKHCATAAPERKSWFSSHVLCDSKSVTSEVIIIVSPIKSSLECVTQSVSQTFAPHSGESFAKFTDWLQLLAHCRDAIMPFMLKFIPDKVCIVYMNSRTSSYLTYLNKGTEMTPGLHHIEILFWCYFHLEKNPLTISFGSCTMFKFLGINISSLFD